MPKITLNPFDPASIDAAIAQVKEYRDSLESKTETLRKRVAEEIAALSQTGFNGAGYDDVIHEGMKVPDVRVSVDEQDNVSIVVAYGNEAVFAEFGAGVYYNGPAGSSPHPWGPGNVFYIGTYGKGYGARKIWGYYDEAGDLKLTHGTPASMPMYHATQDVVNMIVEIAREVFRDGGSS